MNFALSTTRQQREHGMRQRSPERACSADYDPSFQVFEKHVPRTDLGRASSALGQRREDRSGASSPALALSYEKKFDLVDKALHGAVRFPPPRATTPFAHRDPLGTRSRVVVPTEALNGTHAAARQQIALSTRHVPSPSFGKPLDPAKKKHREGWLSGGLAPLQVKYGILGGHGPAANRSTCTNPVSIPKSRRKGPFDIAANDFIDDDGDTMAPFGIGGSRKGASPHDGNSSPGPDDTASLATGEAHAERRRRAHYGRSWFSMDVVSAFNHTRRRLGTALTTGGETNLGGRAPRPELWGDKPLLRESRIRMRPRAGPAPT